MSRRHLLLLALGILTALGLLAGFLLTLEKSGARSITLRDGTGISLLKITTHTNHTYAGGNILQRLGARVLPRKWARRMQSETFVMPTTVPTYGFWLQSDHPTNPVPPFGLGTRTSLFITDAAHGYYRSSGTMTARRGTRVMECALFTALPTGSRTVRLTFQTPPFSGPEDYLEVENPAYLARPSWKDHPYPIRIQSNDLEVIIHELRANDLDPPPRPITSALRYEVRELRATNTFLHLANLQVSHEGGSPWSVTRLPNDMFGPRDTLRFQCALSTNSLWKLHFQFESGTLGNSNRRTRHVEAIVRPLPAPPKP